MSPERLFEALSSEYPARYLEQVLHIAPSRAAQELMRANVVLGPKNVKAALRLRGALADEAVLVPPEVSVNARSLSHAGSHLGATNRANQAAMMKRLQDLARQDAPGKPFGLKKVTWR